MTAPPTKLVFPQKASWALIGIFWLMFFGVIVVAQSFFVPLVISIFLALIFSPIRRGLGRIGIRPGVAAALILGALVTAIVSATFLLSNTLQSRLDTAPELIPLAIERLTEATRPIEPMIAVGEQLDEAAAEMDGSETIVVREEGALSVMTSATPVIIGQIIFALTMMFFLIASGDMFYEKLVEVMPTIRDKHRAIAIARDIESQLSTYFLTITVINAGLGVAIGLAMWTLGMPDPILFGFAAFFLNYIPYLGAIFGVAVSFLVGVVTMDGSVATAFVPAFVYWALSSLEGQFVTPYLVGRRLKLNAVVVFLSVAIWAWLWSFVGMFLSTPMLIALKAFSNRIDSLESLGSFLGQRRELDGRDGVIFRRVFGTTEKPKPAPTPADKEAV
ncbi:MAG: AI-2E family transporter [Pseudomonadota bacterium]